MLFVDVRSWELPSGKLTGRNGKPPCLIGDTSTQMVDFPFVMSVYQRVTYSPGNPFVALLSPWIFPFKLLDMLSNLLCNESFLVMGTNKSTLYQRRWYFIHPYIKEESADQLMIIDASQQISTFYSSEILRTS